MHLTGQVASVLVGGPDNGSGGEVAGDSLVGLLLHPRGSSGSGVDRGAESDAAVFGEGGSLIVQVEQFIRGSIVVFLAHFLPSFLFLRDLLVLRNLFFVVLSDRLSFVYDWLGVGSFLICGGLVSFRMEPCWGLLSGFSLY